MVFPQKEGLGIDASRANIQVDYHIWKGTFQASVILQKKPIETHQADHRGTKSTVFDTAIVLKHLVEDERFVVDHGLFLLNDGGDSVDLKPLNHTVFGPAQKMFVEVQINVFN